MTNHLIEILNISTRQYVQPTLPNCRFLALLFVVCDFPNGKYSGGLIKLSELACKMVYDENHPEIGGGP